MSQHLCDETKPIHTPLTPQSLVLSIDENKTSSLSNGKTPVFNLGEDKEADAKTLITPHFISTSSVHVKAACSKSRLKVWTSWIAGFYCLLVFEDEQQSASNISHCSSLSSFVPRISSASFTLYTPWNPARPNFTINYQSSPYTGISLTFPRMLPPDSEIFMYIRAGQLEKVKNLLLQGRASILDIAAPFGLSTLSVALSYKRMDIYNFLMIAGGNRCHPVPSNTSGAEQHEFWLKFGSQDYKISAADILQDDIQQTVSISGVDRYNVDVQYAGVDYESLTRLHKCVLGFTIESLQSLLPELACLDDVDFLGHTALHLATSKNDAKTIALLLNWGADAEIKENTGKTPLHISAIQDSDKCTMVLLRYGANVRAKDHLGNTPLHYACKRGHLRIMKILIGHGADLMDCNYFGETPLIYANLGDQLAAVQLLQQHNVDLTHRNKLGITLVHDAIWFNSHEALEFYLKSSLRVDQKLQNGKSTLHLLAEEGDAVTMKIFLDFAEKGLEKLRANDKDDRGCTAMQYLNCRRDVTEVMPLFNLVLARVCNTCHYSKDKEDNDVFWDAVESQL
jgi:ankyrin repeat protein